MNKRYKELINYTVDDLIKYVIELENELLVLDDQLEKLENEADGVNKCVTNAIAIGVEAP